MGWFEPASVFIHSMVRAAIFFTFSGSWITIHSTGWPFPAEAAYRAIVQEERLRRTVSFALPATKTHVGVCIPDFWQGALIGGFDHTNYTDSGANPAPSAEILVDEYCCH